MQSPANTSGSHLCQSLSRKQARKPKQQTHPESPIPPSGAQASATSSKQRTSRSSPFRQRSPDGLHNEKALARSSQPVAAMTQAQATNRSQTGSECRTSSIYQLSATIVEEPGHRIEPGPSHRPFPSWITAILPLSPVFRVCGHHSCQLRVILHKTHVAPFLILDKHRQRYLSKPHHLRHMPQDEV